MNWDQVKGQWKQMRGTLRKEWGKLTDDDLDVIAGNRERFVGLVQERYGIAREEAERRTSAWMNRKQGTQTVEERTRTAGSELDIEE